MGGGEGGEVGYGAGGVGVDQGAGDAAGAVEILQRVLALVIVAEPGPAGYVDARGDFLRGRGGDELVELVAGDFGRYGRKIQHHHVARVEIGAGRAGQDHLHGFLGRLGFCHESPEVRLILAYGQKTLRDRRRDELGGESLVADLMVDHVESRRQEQDQSRSQRYHYFFQHVAYREIGRAHV